MLYLHKPVQTFYKLLSYAEVPEDDVEQVLHVDAPGDATQLSRSRPELLARQVKGGLSGQGMRARTH